MELKIERNKLITDGNETTLTDEQLKELGIEPSPFDMIDGELFFFVNGMGALAFGYYDNDECGEDYEDCDEFFSEIGKICKDKDLMNQKRLRQNLNDLLWKFTIENGWNDEVWEDGTKRKYYVIYNLENGELDIDYISTWKTLGIIYFASEEIAQRAIDEIVKPYMEENPKFVW